MKILHKKKYLTDLKIECEKYLFKNPELYYYRLRMLEFIEKIDFNKDITLYYSNEYIHALRMRYFTKYGWRNKRYYELSKKNDLRNKHVKQLQLKINFY